MSNKTAMQELIERLEFIKSTAITDDARSSFQVAISSAKSRLEKEKNDLITAHKNGYLDRYKIANSLVQNEKINHHTEYYNETFGNEKQEKRNK